MATSVKDLYIKVWRFREEMEEFWPTPSEGDSWRFAFCEVSEALDAWLRLKPNYKRNRDIIVDQTEILNELADCAMLLLTALGPATPVHSADGIHNAVDLDTLCTWISKTWEAYRNRRINPTYWKTQIIAIVTAISRYPEMDLEARLDARFERIRAKQLPVSA